MVNNNIMTKSEIIEKLQPRCNGYDLPLSLNLALVAEILTEPSVVENAVLPRVSSRFSLLMLTSRLLTLELELKEANLQMLTYPNEFTDQQIVVITPMLEDLRKAVAVLENGY